MFTYSIIIISFRREDALRETLADLRGKIGARDDVELVLVDNNADGTDRSDFLEGFANPRYYAAPDNLGVAGGRNAGVRNASGRFLIFLDDDAVFVGDDFLEVVQRYFDADPGLGAIAARSTNFFSGEMDRAEFPHTDKTLDPDRSFVTFRFIGVCHAIRKEVFEEAGLYDDDFFFGQEEADLSYRAIKCGYGIRYAPELHVLHKKDPAGRLPQVGVVERALFNRMRVNFMHLPLPNFLVSIAVWNTWSVCRSRARLNLPKVWWRFWLWARQNAKRRQPMKGEALAYVRACGANIWK